MRTKNVLSVTSNNKTLYVNELDTFNDKWDFDKVPYMINAGVNVGMGSMYRMYWVKILESM